MEESYMPERWGWKQEFCSAWISKAAEEAEVRVLLPARVTGSERHLYEITCPDFSGRIPPGAVSTGDAGALASRGRHSGVRVCGRFEFAAEGEADFPVTGDWVLADFSEGSPRIRAVLPRRSALRRGRAGERSEAQVLAANIDTLLLVFALDGGRNFLPRFLERALVVARDSGASPCVVLNKADLADEEYRAVALAEAAAAAPAAPIFAVSARTGEGLDELEAILPPGDTVGMIGKSGVGKSALINALGQALGASHGNTLGESGGGNPRFLAREGQVRGADLRGRHTTTSSRLYRLGSGLLMIDSPGIRELKVLGDAEDLDGGFPEVAEFAERCRFGDCTHSGEPGCAVLAAVESGELGRDRYQAWLALAREQAWYRRRSSAREYDEYRRKWKQIAKLQKELKKGR